MLELLFGDRFIWTLICFGIIALLYFFANNKPVRALVYGALYMGLIVTGVFSLGHLNNYYGATGGVHGELSALIKKNQVEIEQEVDAINFNFKNVVLMENDKGVYMASMTSEQVLKLDENETYFIYVNDQPCTTIQAEERDIYATYNYTFLNREAGEYYSLADDEMTFYFAFYDNYSYLQVQVENGADTYQLWNSYFNKNNFKVKIAKVEKTFYDSTKYSQINLMLNGQNYNTVILKNGTDYTLPTAEKMTCADFTFNNWKDADGNVVTSIDDVSENITLMADVTYNYKANFVVDGVVVYTYTGIDGSIIVSPETPTKNGYTFSHWQDENGRYVSLNNLAITSNRTFTAVFNYGYTYSGDAIKKVVGYDKTDGSSLTEMKIVNQDLLNVYQSGDYKELVLNLEIGFMIYDFSVADQGTNHYISNQSNTNITLTIKPSGTASQTVSYTLIHKLADTEIQDTINVTFTFSVEMHDNYLMLKVPPVTRTQLSGDAAANHNYKISPITYYFNSINLYTV